ncbi:hypothetical protein EVJ58_g7008 [Rhodofomes roseus]|uniref:GP-PDE domain-containing protein n=1 Tax=Rhodofomes roseus TaxID=34475 RepID=A0A4Y9Y4N5_9APHY|nr:hypothetical protein EVJ58_g7008 [Rhodofomes roseus]
MPPKIPECWGHRGASVAFPENTLASFERAIRDGADGIETDVHISQDDVVIMFHDPTLQRTTNGFGTCLPLRRSRPAPGHACSWTLYSTGMIKEHKWYGPNGMQQLRTKKEPKQPIPTFDETIALFMRPENRHAKLHIDIKPSNSLGKIFALMARTIRAYDAWETALAPRILLGVWHTNYAIRWGIDVIMTDVPHVLHALRRDLEGTPSTPSPSPRNTDPASRQRTGTRRSRATRARFLWKHHRYYWPVTLFWATFVRVLLQAAYGRLGKVAPAARRALDVVDEIGAPPPDISKTGNGYTVTENGGVVNGDAAPKAVADADGDYPNGDVPQ